MCVASAKFRHTTREADAVSVPHEAAFFYQKSILQSRIEDCVDVLFVMDVFYTFRTAYVNEQGVVVRDGAKIVKHYMQTWFPIDCAASLPLEYIILMFGINGSSSLKYLAMFKVCYDSCATLSMLSKQSTTHGCCCRRRAFSALEGYSGSLRRSRMQMSSEYSD